MLTTTVAPQFETHYTPEPRNRMRLLAHPYLIAAGMRNAHSANSGLDSKDAKIEKRKCRSRNQSCAMAKIPNVVHCRPSVDDGCPDFFILPKP